VIGSASRARMGDAGPLRVMVSCGEASGDLYAAALTRELTALAPGTEVFGFGGARLAEAGGHLSGDYARFAVTGLSEALSVVPRSLRMIRHLAAQAADRRPDVFVAIDFPDFNFRLLPRIHTLGIPIVYYISPQIWAWRASRIEVLRRYVSKMLVIFPFEAGIYEKASVPVEFVGHPLVDLAVPSEPRTAWLERHGLDPRRPLVALLPGSRPNEVGRLVPVVADALPAIEARVPGVQFVVARAPSLGDAAFARLGGRSNVRIVTGATDDALAAADVVVTASGTATVQTALHGRPMVIVYRLSRFDYALGRAFVKLPHYGMVNLIAGRGVVPELIQDACTPTRVADEVVTLLTDDARSARMHADLAEVRHRLGSTGASRRAALAVLDVAATGRSLPVFEPPGP
jgi:lipid-A-disaccharide synthase